MSAMSGGLKPLREPLTGATTHAAYTRAMPKAMTWRLLAAVAFLVVVASACAPPSVARAAKPVLDEPPREEPYPREALAAARVTRAGCDLEGDVPSGGGFSPDLDLRGDPSFDPADLPADVLCWYETLWDVVSDPDRAAYFTRRAQRADLYTYSREVNNHLVALFTAFRVTGDLALLDEIDRLGQHMRAQLDDAWQGRASRDDGAADGYLNWVWDQDNSDEHRGRDVHEIDEMRTHSMIAQLAYAYAANADLQSPNGVDYAERAAFWTEYLRDHFEAKWRERNDVPWPRFPFLERPHLHETVEFARYHHYMHLLTGEEAYAEEARRLSRVSYENFREAETPSGPALVTPRSVLSMGGSLEYLLPSIYFRHVVATVVDLHFEGVEPWSDDEVMAKLARTLSEFILDGEGNGYGRDVGGGRSRAGIEASGERDWSRISTGVYNISAFALLAAWDDSGEVAEVSVAVHDHRGEREKSVFVPSGLLLWAALGEEALAAGGD